MTQNVAGPKEALGNDDYSLLEGVARYHLDQMRRFGAGWRAPQVRRHKEAFQHCVRLRRLVRYGVTS